MVHLSTPQTTLQPLPAQLTKPLLEQALKEDLGQAGDITSQFTLPLHARAKFILKSREAGRIAGLKEALDVFHFLDPNLKASVATPDGSDVLPETKLAEISGSAHALLGAERTALNILGHLSGVASLTQKFVKETETSMARITATRKTLPGLHALQRHAVLLGGGADHRHTLSDAILIKDNHIAVLGSVGNALDLARNRAGHMVRLAVEIDTLDRFEEALSREPDIILLDNMKIKDIREAVRKAANHIVLEASGGITLENVKEFAETGVDILSIGALTHSAPALDIGLDFKPL